MRTLRIFFAALFHRRTPLRAKLAILTAVLYGILPVDLVPDLLPLLGMMDDLAAVIFAVMLFLRFTKGIRKQLDTEL